MAIGLATTIPYALIMAFSISDVSAARHGIFPALIAYYQATGSKAVTIVLMVFSQILYAGCLITSAITAGRLTWAFARDNGIPFSSYFDKVHPSKQIPVRATIFACAIASIYGLIYIASTVAFTSIQNLAILALNASYVIPQAIVLYRGRERVLPERSFNLGKFWGPLCNGFSTLWIALYTVIFCMPSSIPVALSSMTYVSVVLVAILTFVTIYWLSHKRLTFVGPDIPNL